MGIVRIGEGRSRRAASFDLGVLHTISAALAVAVYFRSVTGSPERAEFAFDPALVVGIAWRAEDSLTLMADVEQSADHPASPRVGVEWSPVTGLAIQAGTAWQPDRISGGLRIERGRIHLQLAAGYHDPLGITSAAGLAIRW